MKTLHILHLEEATSDREFVRQALETAQLSCEFTYAATRDEFQAALKQSVFDWV
jgi:hypothetical protein